MLFSENDKKEIKNISEEAIEDYEYNTEIIRKEYSRKSLRQDINVLTKQVEELAKTVEDLKEQLSQQVVLNKKLQKQLDKKAQAAREGVYDDDYLVNYD